MEIEKNGNQALPDIPVESHGRIYPATPDGSQWEVRIHLSSDLGRGREIIGEVVYRSYNGGIALLPGMVDESSKLAANLIAPIARQAEAAQRRVIPATQMPPEPKN